MEVSWRCRHQGGGLVRSPVTGHSSRDPPAGSIHSRYQSRPVTLTETGSRWQKGQVPSTLAFNANHVCHSFIRAASKSGWSITFKATEIGEAFQSNGLSGVSA